MYVQKEAINVQVLYDLAVKRKDVYADQLYNTCWGIFAQSKLIDLSIVKVVYNEEVSTGVFNAKFCHYDELPEIMKQLEALVVCLIGRWFDDLHSGKDAILERFKLNCKPTDFWHNTGIFKHDHIKCRNMEELIEKIYTGTN